MNWTATDEFSDNYTKPIEDSKCEGCGGMFEEKEVTILMVDELVGGKWKSIGYNVCEKCKDKAMKEDTDFLTNK